MPTAVFAQLFLHHPLTSDKATILDISRPPHGRNSAFLIVLRPFEGALTANYLIETSQGAFTVDCRNSKHVVVKKN